MDIFVCSIYNINAAFFSLTGSRKVVVCNIHVLYNPNRGEIKLGQVCTDNILSNSDSFCI